MISDEDTSWEMAADILWNSLTKEQQLQLFYVVTNKLYVGEILDQGTYRHVLYSVFGFGPDAYIVGMNSGFLELHNKIVVD